MRLLIVGAGPRGIEHGEAIRELPGWTVAGVVDPRLEGPASLRMNDRNGLDVRPLMVSD